MAVKRDDYWMTAAAWGYAPVDLGGYICVAYTDALNYLCRPRGKDGRRRYRIEITDCTVPDEGDCAE
jgi:hypothetical protein